MPGPAPKHPSARARRNRTSTARTLSVVHDVEAPELPPNLGEDGVPVPWHPQTLEWWADVWASPMAPEFDASDLHGLFLLARLVDAAWHASSPKELKEILAEVRLQRQCFGLTPIDRRRLQWEIDRGDAAIEATEKRRAARAPRAAEKGDADPRLALA